VFKKRKIAALWLSVVMVLVLFGVANVMFGPGVWSASTIIEAENGTKLGSAVNYSDSAASNGIAVGYINTPGNGVQFTNVQAAAQLLVRYSTMNNGTLSLYINGTHNQNISFTSTGNWYTNYASKAINVSIPAGATVKIQYDSGDVAVNLDYIILYDKLEAENMPKYGGAKNYSDSAASNGAGVGYMDTATGNAVEFANVPAGNQLNIRYATIYNGTLSLYINGTHNQDVTYNSTGSWTGSYSIKNVIVNIPSGVTVKLQYDSGDVAINIDYIESFTANTPTPVPTPPPPPPSGTRTVMSLNGTWNCEEATESTKDIIPSSWDHTLPLPGLVDQASPALGSYNYVFYRRTFTISGNVADVALLKLHKGFWGKKVWLNGSLVGEHQPNFTPGYLDVKSYLRGNGQTNDLVIRVGAKGTQPSGFNPGSDFEKHVYTPGLYDNVDLIMSGYYNVVRVQTAPDLTNNRLRVVAHVKNSSGSSATITVGLEVREAVSNNLMGTKNTSITLGAGAEGDVDDYVAVPNCHPWTPEDPFLYKLGVTTNNDRFDTKFGMRTFQFDPATKKPMLNGKIYMLRGTNICFYRFFEDSERGNHPWDKAWARQVIQKHKSLNMNSVRYCIGFPPEIWYEVADEEGFLVQDEYPIWRLGDPMDNGCTAASITPEVKDWMYERANHPCVFMWDICNETNDAITGQIIQNCRGVDIQNRSWDNGWAAAQSSTDTSEQHIYKNQGNPGWTTEQFENENMGDQYAAPAHPVIINEYGWIWINRDASPTTLAVDVYNTQVPGGTADQRRDFHAKVTAQKTEFWRVCRNAGVLQFCGLGYCRTSDGQTSDNWMPGLSNLQFDPFFEKYVKDSFAPAGLMIHYWQRSETPGASRTIPVYLSNDESQPWSGNVTLKIMQGTTTVTQVTRSFSNVATGYRASVDYPITFPTAAGNYQLIAEYIENSVTVQSVRDVLVEDPGLGYNKPITASSEYDNTCRAINANDGNTGTRWSSQFSDPQWIRIDLGSTKTITKVELKWESAYGKDYQIQVSNDGTNWTTIYTRTNGTGGDEIINLSGSGRYIRMNGTARGAQWGYSLWEFKVW
jgi:beta-galactosidase